MRTMLALIQSIHQEFKGAYGSPRMVRSYGCAASGGQGARGTTDARERHQGETQTAFRGHNRLEAQPAVVPNLLERTSTPDAPIRSGHPTSPTCGRMKAGVSGDCDRPVQTVKWWAGR